MPRAMRGRIAEGLDPLGQPPRKAWRLSLEFADNMQARQSSVVPSLNFLREPKMCDAAARLSWPGSSNS